MSVEWSTSVSQATNERRSSIRNPRSFVAAFFVCLIVSQSIGCFTLQKDPNELLVSKLIDVGVENYRDKVWAERAYNLRYSDCARDYGNHFKNGFVDGYCNVCNGSKGYVPAMPPEKYWGNEYQCADGAKCVNAWFEGFPAGARAAKKDSAGTFRNVYISNMINSAITQEKKQEDLPKKTANVPPAPPLDPADTLSQESRAMPGSGPNLVPEYSQMDYPSEPKEPGSLLPLIIQPAQYTEATEY